MKKLHREAGWAFVCLVTGGGALILADWIYDLHWLRSAPDNIDRQIHIDANIQSLKPLSNEPLNALIPSDDKIGDALSINIAPKSNIITFQYVGNRKDSQPTILNINSEGLYSNPYRHILKCTGIFLNELPINAKLVKDGKYFKVFSVPYDFGHAKFNFKIPANGGVQFYCKFDPLDVNFVNRRIEIINSLRDEAVQRSKLPHLTRIENILITTSLYGANDVSLNGAESISGELKIFRNANSNSSGPATLLGVNSNNNVAIVSWSDQNRESARNEINLVIGVLFSIFASALLEVCKPVIDDPVLTVSNSKFFKRSKCLLRKMQVRLRKFFRNPIPPRS